MRDLRPHVGRARCDLAGRRQFHRAIAGAIPADREGYKVSEKLIFIDKAITGTSRFGRDGMAELIEAVRARKFDVLICESQSRLARDVEDFAFLSKRLKF